MLAAVVPEVADIATHRGLLFVLPNASPLQFVLLPGSVLEYQLMPSELTAHTVDDAAIAMNMPWAYLIVVHDWLDGRPGVEAVQFKPSFRL
jgi:hypothetical protein